MSSRATTGQLDRFLVFPENRFAWQTTNLLATCSTPPYVPVFVYGPSGCGKTHLLRSVLRSFHASFPAGSSLLINGGEFAAEFAESAEKKTIASWQTRLRKLDFLAFDDLHVLEGRHKTQVQFISLFDDLLSHQKRILLSSKRPLGEIPDISKKLISRCHGAIQAPIQLPDAPSRLEYLRHVGSTYQIPVTEKLLILIAEAKPASPSELLGFLLTLDQRSREQRVSISLGLVRKLLQEQPSSGGITLSRIVKETAQVYRLPSSEIRGRGRGGLLTQARQVAMFLARELTSETLARIGEFFDGRDHTTVITACQRILDLTPQDRDLAGQMELIKRNLTGR